MTSRPSGNPIRTILWFVRGVAILMLVVDSLTGMRLLSESNAILVTGIVVTFFIERPLLDRFASKGGSTPVPEPQSRASKTFADAYFAFVVGSMRVVGGLFVAVGLLVGSTTVLNWSDSARGFGGSTGVIGVLLLLSAFIGLGVFLLLGRHLPLMRSLREMGEQHRRKD